MNAHPKTERGQALVLVALAVIGLIGLTALTIDGGNAYSDRRHAQNAADTAAMSAALAKVRGTNWQSAGLVRAASNGYDNNGTTNTVEIYNPPILGVYTGDAQYIQVIITSHVETYFAKVLGVQQMTNKVNAVARATPTTYKAMFDGNAVVGLAPSECKAVKYQGNANTTLVGGGIFVNSNCKDSAFFNNSSAAKLTAPGLCSVGGIKYKEGAIEIPSIKTGCHEFAYPPKEIIMPTITCSDTALKSGNTLSPGNFNGTFPPAGVTHLQSGAYCVVGNFRMNAGDTLTGSDVVIFVKTGDVRWNGGATIQLDAPNTGPYKGLLIVLPLTNTNEVVINGSSSSSFTGTFLAPASAVTINGSGSSSGMNSQVIGYTVDLSGTSDIKIVYNDEDNYDAGVPPKIEFTE